MANYCHCSELQERLSMRGAELAYKTLCVTYNYDA
jgi:hypothetical protein